MNSKNGIRNDETSLKQMIIKGLTSSSAAAITPHNGGLVRQKTNVRATSAKYYDIASKILGGSSDIEELFLTSAKNGNHSKLEQLLQQSDEIGLNINCTDKRTGNTALIWVSKRGYSKAAELLLRYGADATACNYEAHTALDTAFSPVKTIILDWVETQEDINERLLLQAAWQGNLHIVKKILLNKNSININYQNIEGLTPLMLVCRDVQLFERLCSQLNRPYNPVQVAEELMKHNADIHVTDKDGRSCLHYAAQSHSGCSNSLTLTLVSGGFDIDLCDKHQLTPLHLASQSGNTNNVIALLDRGSNVNAKGFAGLTPLHMIAMKDHLVTAQTVLKYGADITIVDDHGSSPLDVAKSKKMRNVLKDAWLTAKANSNQSHDGASVNKCDGGDDKEIQKSENIQTKNEELSNASNPPEKSQKTKSNQSNKERFRPAERKTLTVIEAFKAAHPMLQKEIAHILGTPKANVLPQIRQSTSPENSNKLSQVNLETKSSQKRPEVLQRSLEEAQFKLAAKGRSVLDIKQGVGRPTEISNTSNGNHDYTNNLKKSVHQRSDSDPVKFHTRDIVSSCDSLLVCNNGNKNIKFKSKDHTLNRDVSKTIVKLQKEHQCNENDPSHQDNILKSLGSPSEILRSHTILKEELVLEENRPKEISSGSDPASSLSSCSQSSSSPRDLSFVQPSPSRSIRHDISLSTLIEQQASTDFSVPDNFVNIDGKPNFLKAHKKLRKRSDNSLSSSLESDNDELLIEKAIAMSDARKHIDRADNTNQELISSSYQISVHKSQSLESISPKAHPNILEECPTSRFVVAKSNSEENIDKVNKHIMQTLKSKLSESSKNGVKVMTRKQPDILKCMKTSKKPLIEAFIGRTTVVTNNKAKPVVDHSLPTCLRNKNIDSVCPKTFAVMHQKQEDTKNKHLHQKLASAADVNNVLIKKACSLAPTRKAANVSPSHSIKPLPVSGQIIKSQGLHKSPDTFPQPDIAKQFTSISNKVEDYSTKKLGPPLSTEPNKQIIGIVQELIDKSESPEGDIFSVSLNTNTITSAESNKCKSKNNQKVEKCDILEESKKSDICGTKTNEKKMPDDKRNDLIDRTESKDMFSNVKKQSTSDLYEEPNNSPNVLSTAESIPIVYTSKPNISSNAAESTHEVYRSDTQLYSTPTKQKEHITTNITKKPPFSKSALCKDNTNSGSSKMLFKVQEETKTDKDCKGKEELSKMNFNSLKNKYSSKFQSELKTMSTEILNTKTTLPENKIDSDCAEVNNKTIISTPVIVNPFEEFVQAHITVNDNTSMDEIVKVKKQPNINKINTKNIKKPTTTTIALSRKKHSAATSRQVSASKKQNSKSKDIKIETTQRPKTGRKSAKIQQSKKIDKTAKSNLNEDNLTLGNAPISVNGLPLTNLLDDVGDLENNDNSDTQLYSSDSDFSLDLEENDNVPFDKNQSKENCFNKNTIETDEEEQTVEVISSELKNPIYSLLSPKHNELPCNNLKTSKSIMSQGNTCSIQEHIHTNINPSVIEVNHVSSQQNCQFIDDQNMYINNKTNHEKTSLPKGSRAVLASKITNPETFLHSNDASQKDKERQNKNTKDINCNIEITKDLDISKNQNTEFISKVQIEQHAVNYEYTPSGKIVQRSQSLKEFPKNNMLKPKLQNVGRESISEKVDDELDDIIEEILTSTTSSVATATKKLKSQLHDHHVPDIHSITENDKSLLLKMTSSTFSSPFHATMSMNQKEFLEDDVDDLTDRDVSPNNVCIPSHRGSSTTGKVTKDISISPEQHKKLDQSHVTAFLSHKPPLSSGRDVGAPRPVTVRRSSSNREGKRQQTNSRNGANVTDLDTQHMMKILNSFRKTDLQVGNNSTDFKSMLGFCGQESLHAKLSVKSKDNFQEIKSEATATRISTKFIETPTTGVHSDIPDSKCAAEIIECEGNEAIQWKRGNILGRGAFGTVWCGLTGDGQLIAVKQIELTTVDKTKAQLEYRNVQMEVDILKTLEHENIVSYLGTSLEDNIVSIFMQYIPGGSIASILARFGALDESVFRIYTKQILEGVKYLHSNDVIHRDIKGANVMVMHNGIIKLIDFGCAKRLYFNLSISQAEVLKSMNGTPFWMAPEVVNESGHGKKSDIWSIGCTVFEMATIKPPWADMNPMAAIFAIGLPSRPVPELGSKFSSDAREFVSCCLTRDQETRPGAAELLEHPFISRQPIPKPSRSDD